MQLKNLLFLITILSLSKCLRGDRHCAQKLGITGEDNGKSVNLEYYDSHVNCEQRQCMTTSFKITYNVGESFDVDYRDCVPKEDDIDKELTTCGENINMTKVFDKIEKDIDKYINKASDTNVNMYLDKGAGVSLKSYDEEFKDIIEKRMKKHKANVTSISRYQITEAKIGGHYTVKCCNKDYCNMSVNTKYNIGLVMSVIFLSLFVIKR
uniref:Variable surface protein n=1 Tax=Strongyloides papillosus TaxID=174720 RepID=A0A0N5BGN7_STREA